MWSFPVLQRGSYPRTARSLVNSRRRVPCASRVHEWHHLHLLTPTHSLGEYAGVLLVPKEQHSVFWIYQTWHPERLLGLQVNPSLQHCCKELTAISLRAHKIKTVFNEYSRSVGAEQKAPICLSSFNSHNQHTNELFLFTLYRKRLTHWKLRGEVS